LKKVSLLLIIIVILLGVLPTTINLVGPFTSKISVVRSDISPYRNAFANTLIEIVEGSPYLLPSQPIPSEDQQIVKLANELTAGLYSNLEKSKAIFTWVAQNITYDVETFYSNKNFYLEHPDAIEVLNSKLAMCMGYSRLNAALHRAAGIEAKVVFGEGHAWNEIKINGKWQTQDTTYAAGFLNEVSQTFIKQYMSLYFSKTDVMKEGEYDW
jgi:transglutaminase-like putative cysteine protease